MSFRYILHLIMKAKSTLRNKSLASQIQGKYDQSQNTKMTARSTCIIGSPCDINPWMIKLALLAILICCLHLSHAVPVTQVKGAALSSEREEFGTQEGAEDPEIGLKYLTRFGYLEDKPNSIRSPEELRQAIVHLQAMAALQETGQLDDATLDKMGHPRCGFPDVPVMGTSGFGVMRPVDPNDPMPYELGPSKWDKNTLTYRLNRYKLTRDISEAEIRRDIQGAIQLWERASPLRFVDADSSGASQYLGSGENPDIEITFDRWNHGDGNDFDGPGKVLAHAFFPGSGIGGDVHFDDDETWSSQSPKGTNLLIVAAHELGHSLGLSHSRQKGSLMYPWYAGYTANYELHSDDVLGIQYIYGGTQPTVPTPRMETMSPAVPTGDPERLDTCGGVDDVALIRGELFAFSGKWFWRMNEVGSITSGPYQLQEFWRSLPTTVSRIDAAFERPENGRIVFISGKNYYEFDGTTILPQYLPNGRPITDFGITSNVTRIDTALVWGYNKRVYLFSDRNYWRLSLGKEQINVDYGYPRSVDRVWRGLPFPMDTAYTNTNNTTYFTKGTNFWLYDDRQSTAQRGYPRSVSQLWKHCSNSLRSSAISAMKMPSQMMSTYLSVTLVTIFTIVGSSRY